MNLSRALRWVYIYLFLNIQCLLTQPKGDLWVQSPVIIIGNIRSIAENRRRSTEAYRRVMSTWPSMMVGTAEGDLPKLFSPALLA